ncbi:hypothetical protein HA152_07415 [Prochlorococcus marinus XMU1412]|uniref:TylF/MycF/NovP-related O-methyltransferase n=1 Tax=Prochlorococcus marinus TaxID=1219 RepID=UPI001ADCD82E|nr:TylF/MycF/NovP-related O-methyltransferase [Prochlorococcus marinus]MBO8240530.1 hypothetical protein [Prochlorococcus marinus XMU1412]
MKLKIQKPNNSSYLSEIHKVVIKEIDDHHLSISRELAKAVSYTYMMGVKGDIAEFGTMTGYSAVALATAVNLRDFEYRNDKRGNKNLHFFDSFEGLPEATNDIDKNSPHVLDGIWSKGTCKGLSKKEFENQICKYISRKKFFVYKGWFKDTVSLINDESCFSLVHIDGDLYESAIDVLDPLFKRKIISKGAIILFDDWNCNASNPNLGEKRAFREIIDKYDVEYTDEGGYSASAHKFIIHNYK